MSLMINAFNTLIKNTNYVGYAGSLATGDGFSSSIFNNSIDNYMKYVDSYIANNLNFGDDIATGALSPYITNLSNSNLMKYIVSHFGSVAANSYDNPFA